MWPNSYISSHVLWSYSRRNRTSHEMCFLTSWGCGTTGTRNRFCMGHSKNMRLRVRLWPNMCLVFGRRTSKVLLHYLLQSFILTVHHLCRLKLVTRI
ncbi:hypothetical protein C8Q78DRAFT_1056491 [Trametes maxima]|nr:hypothetical protein C8Q78DRAFT_1056491 [Trametes maxima]